MRLKNLTSTGLILIFLVTAPVAAETPRTEDPPAASEVPARPERTDPCRSGNCGLEYQTRGDRTSSFRSALNLRNGMGSHRSRRTSSYRRGGRRGGRSFSRAKRGRFRSTSRRSFRVRRR